MVLSADGLSFQEFMNRESLPLATLHGAVFEFLRDRQDVVVFGAQAVNAYVGEPRSRGEALANQFFLDSSKLLSASALPLQEFFYAL